MRNIIILVLSLIVCAQVSAFPKAQATRATNDVDIDGKLNDPVWQKAPVYSNFYLFHKYGKSEPSKKTSFQIAYDNKAIYFAITCHQDELEKASSQTATRDGDVWKDDSIEIFLNPGGKYYYHFIVNSIGTKYDEQLAFPNSNVKAMGKKWTGVWQAKSKRDKDGWTVEIRIPLATLNLSKQTKPSWGLNINRTIAKAPKHFTWSLVHKHFKEPNHFGTLHGLKINTNKFVIDDSKINFPPLFLGNNQVEFSLPVTKNDNFLVQITSEKWRSKKKINKSDAHTKVVSSKKNKLPISFNVPVKEINKQRSFILAIANSKGEPIVLRSHIYKAPSPLITSLNRMVYYASDGYIKLNVMLNTSGKISNGNIKIMVFHNQKKITQHTFHVKNGHQQLTIPIDNFARGKYRLKVMGHFGNVYLPTNKIIFYIVSGPFE